MEMTTPDIEAARANMREASLGPGTHRVINALKAGVEALDYLQARVVEAERERDEARTEIDRRITQNASYKTVIDEQVSLSGDLRTQLATLRAAIAEAVRRADSVVGDPLAFPAYITKPLRNLDQPEPEGKAEQVTCQSCGKKWPKAKPGWVHKCRCGVVIDYSTQPEPEDAPVEAGHELDITNADHIALWLDENRGMGAPYLAVQIVEAFERAITRKHVWWMAGDPDCPQEIKARNGELHTLRCKVCGQEVGRAGEICRGLVRGEGVER